ncbi:MAG: hypothetical protein V4594_01890 [Bacteroidota bacterium]
MEQSFQPTDYVIIRAGTKLQPKACNFVLLHLTPPWLFIMRQRLAVVAPFRSDNSFYSHVYWDEPFGFYVAEPDTEADRILKQLARDCDSWAYLTVDDPDELALLDVPKCNLTLHTFMINADGCASYTCIGSQTREEYATQWFSIKQVLKIRG